MSEIRNTTDTLEALRKNEEKFRLIADNSIDVLWQMDLKLKFTYVSPSIYPMFGYTPEEWTGTYLYGHATRREFVKMARQVITAIKNFKSFTHVRFEAILLKKNMEKIPVEIIGRLMLNENGVPIGLQGSTRDITERKKADEALRINESRYRMAQAIAHVGNWEYNLKTAHFWTSEEGRRIYGFSPDATDFTTEAVENCIPESERVHQALVDLIAHDKPYNLEFDIITRDTGERKTIHSIAVLEKDRAGNPLKVTGVISDFTKRKQAEEDLLKYKHIVASTEDGVSLVDSNYRYQIVNPAYEKFSGKNSAEIIGNTVTECLGEAAFKKEIKPHFDRCLAGESVQYKAWFDYAGLGRRLVNVAYFPYHDPDGNICSVVTSTRDITHLHAVEKAQVESEAKFMHYIENSPYGIFVTNEQGNYVDVNPAAAQITGYSHDELIGMNLLDLIAPEEQNLAQQNFKNMLQTGKTSNEIKYVHKDGSHRYWLVTAVQLSANRFLGFTHDITERKQAEEALKASEHKYRRLVETTSEGFWLLDPHKITRDVNPALCEILGYTREEIIGKPPIDFFDVENQAILQTEMAKIETSVHRNYEISITCKDGTKIQVLISATTLLDKNDRLAGSFAMMRDISTLKATENALRVSEEKYRAVFENTGTATCIVEKDGTISLANSKFAQLSGYEIHEILHKKTWMDFVVREDLERMREQHELRRKTKNKASIEYEFRFIDREKNIHHIHLVVDMITGSDKSVASLLDITERKAAEEKIAHTEKYFRALIENAPDGVTINDAQGNLIYASPNALRLFGYDTVDMLGHSGGEFTQPDDIPIITEVFEKITKNPAVKPTVRYRFRKKDGEYRWLETTFTNMLANDTINGIVLNFSDITEKKRAEDLLQVSKKRFEMAMNASQDGLFDWNLITNEIYYSPGWKGMLGYADAELPNDFSVWETHTKPEDIKKSWQIQQEVIAKKRDRFEMEFKMRHKDGHWVDILSRAKAIFDDNGTAVRLVGTHVDITARKQAEAALAVKEERYRNLLENVSAGIGYFDLRGTVVLFNKIAANDMNGNPEDFAGKSIYELFGEQNGAVYYNRIKETTRTDKILTFDDKVELPNATKWFRSRYNKIHDDKGNVAGVQIISTDITDSKDAANQLEQLNATLEAAQKMAKVGYWRYDIASQQSTWSDHMFVVLGVKKENGVPNYQVYKKTWHPEDWEMFDTAVQNCIKGTPYNIIFRVWSPEDQSYHYINTHGFPKKDQNGTINELFGTSQDITHLKKAEADLKASESRYKKLVDTAADAIYLIGENGAILDVNQSACAMLGWTQEELKQLFINSVDPNFPVDDFVSFWEKIPLDRQQIFETTHLTKDGKSIPIEVCGKKFKADNKIFFYALARDITERKKAETEQKELQSQLTQAQKMESVGRLAGGVAHDFNNMLSVIIGNADLALEDLPTGTQLHSDLQEIRIAAQRSADLTRQLLAFARRQTVTPKILNLNDAITSMLKMLGRLIGEDIELLWQPATIHDLIRIDPAQIDQILANLVVNAGDAINDVGQIKIETAVAEFNEVDAQTNVALQPGRYVMLSISDDGHGMDKETINQIFEPFFTTKGVGEGTGLGLATVYGIVKQNLGFINVTSEPDQGTTFRIYLPTCSTPSVEGETPVVNKTPDACGQETILLVEDEATILKLGTKLLQKRGYRVLPAITPGEAIQIAQDHRGEIQLLITDVIMPEMNGRDLAKRLLSLYPDLKRIFMSGYTADIIAHHGVLDEGINFIQKPFSAKSLSQKVHEVLNEE